MGIGYIFGCLLSILLWKFNRQASFAKISRTLYGLTKSNALVYIFYITSIGILLYINYLLGKSEMFNFIAAFVVVDISCTERENLNKKDKVRFYDTISTISRAVICGFTAPLMYILLFGNMCGIVYMIIYNAALSMGEKSMFSVLNNLLNIIPCLLIEILLYIIYCFRNRSIAIDFKGDFFINLITRPMLNVDILAAYLEKVNFYCYYSNKNTDYMKSYGSYDKRIDEGCIKDYLGIAYGICLIVFVAYYVFVII